MYKHFLYSLLLFFSLFIIIGAVAQKQTTKQSNQAKYILKGTITDELTGQKLQGASIYVTELKKGVLTNALGQFQIQLSTGNYIVEASYLGYSINTKHMCLSTPRKIKRFFICIFGFVSAYSCCLHS
jgi:hypothetical protein